MDVTPPAVSARQAVSQMMLGFMLSQALHAAARLGVADVLANGPRPADEIAQHTRTHAPSLRRLLRLLASAEILAEVESGVFALTPMGELLRDVPGSLRAPVLMHTEQSTFAWHHLVDVVRTGQSAHQLVHGMSDWEYFACHPEERAIFDAGMTSFSQFQAEAVAAAYEFPTAGKVVDVGGGHGTLLATILRTRPALHGVLFDAPGVVVGAQETLAFVGVADRCETVAGSFFEAVPELGDLYVLKWIVHDWDDERARAILRCCHRAMAGRGLMLLVERVMPAGLAGPSPEFLDATRGDVQMMAFTGGQERTAEQFRALLESAEFRVSRIIPTVSPLSVIEAQPR